MANERSTDKRGRITIPRELRERFGDDYRVIGLHDGIKLVPVPEDPVGELRSSASDELRAASVDELREAAGSTVSEAEHDGSGA